MLGPIERNVMVEKPREADVSRSLVETMIDKIIRNNELNFDQKTTQIADLFGTVSTIEQSIFPEEKSARTALLSVTDPIFERRVVTIMERLHELWKGLTPDTGRTDGVISYTCRRCEASPYYFMVEDWESHMNAEHCREVTLRIMRHFWSILASLIPMRATTADSVGVFRILDTIDATIPDLKINHA